MRPVGIVTDTTSDLSTTLVEQWSIATAPIYFRIGAEELAMTTTVDRTAFFSRLQRQPLSGTSAVNPHDWLRAYEGLAPDCAEIVALTLSQTLSSTYQSAKIAQSLWTLRRVHCVDSGTVFAGLALLALGAAQKAVADQPLPEVLSWIEEAKTETATLMISPSLAMMVRIGRIPVLKADEQAPAYALLEVRAGVFEVIGTAQSFTEACDHLLDHVIRQYPRLRPERGVIDHGQAPMLARNLAFRVRDRWPQCSITQIDDGPMTAVVADGAGGVAFAIGPMP